MPSGWLSQAVAVVQNHTACLRDERMKKFLHLPNIFSSKETTWKLLWGDSSCFRISKVSFRKCLAEIHRKLANLYETLVIDSKDPFAIALDFLELFSSADAVLKFLIYSGLTC